MSSLSFFFPQTLKKFTVFEMFIIPSNTMHQLADGLKNACNGKAQTDTKGL